MRFRGGRQQVACVAAPKQRAELIRTFHRAHISTDDFAEAAAFIAAAKQHGNSTPEYAGLMQSAVIAYARPFSRNERDEDAAADSRLVVENLGQVLGADQALHETIVTLRNKAVAHAESKFNPMTIVPLSVPDPPGARTDLITASRRWHPAQEGIDLEAFGRIAEAMHRYSRNLQAHLARTISGMTPLPEGTKRS